MSTNSHVFAFFAGEEFRAIWPIKPFSSESFRRSLLLFLFAALAPATSALAAPIEVTRAEFTTAVRVTVKRYETGEEPPRPTYFTNISRTLVSAAPVSDYLKEYHLDFNETNDFPWGMYAVAGATSQRFGVSVFTREGAAQGGNAIADAVFDVTFSPLADEVASIFVDGDGDGLFTYSEGFVSLIDLTANHPLWYYGWGFAGRPFDVMVGLGKDRPEPNWVYDVAGSVSWNFADAGPQRLITQETPFSTDHEYRLVMYTHSAASDDAQGVLLQLSGLEIIPEPSSLTLLSLGALMLFWVRRRC